MKREDLKAGHQYLVDPGTGWVKYGQSMRVLLLDVDTPYRHLSRFDNSEGDLFTAGSRELPSRLIKTPGRSPFDHVVGVRLDAEGKALKGHPDLYATRVIRGLWDEAKAHQDAHAEAMQERKAREVADREAAKEYLRNLREAAPESARQGLDLFPVWRPGIPPAQAKVQITMEALAELLGVDL